MTGRRARPLLGSKGSVTTDLTDQAADRRTERALVAYVRQELSAPATALLGYAEMLMDDAGHADRAQRTDDLQRILDASRTLHRLILNLLDSATIDRIEGSADLAEFHRKLRHDLRTPISAIKGYGEMLRGDASDGIAEPLGADLDKLLAEATLFLERIDGLVTYSDGDAPRSDGVAHTASDLPDGVKVIIECTALLHDPMTEKLQRSAIEPNNPLLNASRSSNLPHVPGIYVGDYIFLSGMVLIDPQTGERSYGSIGEQVLCVPKTRSVLIA